MRSPSPEDKLRGDEATHAAGMRNLQDAADGRLARPLRPAPRQRSKRNRRNQEPRSRSRPRGFGTRVGEDLQEDAPVGKSH
jgi:hypothetical protein